MRIFPENLATLEFKKIVQKFRRHFCESESDANQWGYCPQSKSIESRGARPMCGVGRPSLYKYGGFRGVETPNIKKIEFQYKIDDIS